MFHSIFNLHSFNKMLFDLELMVVTHTYSYYRHTLVHVL